MIIGCMLVRNEEGRYLEQVLKQLKTLCDKIVVVDDCSVDNTIDICRRYGATVHESKKQLWTVDELEQRKRLFCLACAEAKHNDWILCLDADEVFGQSSLSVFKDMLKYAEEQKAEGIGFKLYDMWNPTQYRDDKLWTAHKRQWIMCVQYKQNKKYTWNDKPLHCGRFPLNACETFLPTHLVLRHYGWSTEKDRQKKYRRYMQTDPHGVHGSLAQYISIMDSSPNLVDI